MNEQPPNEAPDRVLSTLNADGSRRWLFPRLSKGRFLNRRRVVGYLLIVIYNVLPWIKIGGKPTILLDLPSREFTFFGVTFLPTDTLVLMLFLAAVFVSIFLLTALFGRLWCGWACPQTVYMELIYRPIERLFDGSPEKRRRGEPGAGGFRKLLKYIAFFIVSLHLAHTFLAYFVGAENLFEWTQRSPLEHPTSFIIVAVVTGLMMFDFAVFREQTCIVACPYGRLQSVMLDRNSLIISYDEKRGEPRGKAKRGASRADVGDCVDCSLCVTTCPTGIDIRDGLQMECIGCAQCIDACDAVMDKLKRSRGLIRYSSQQAMETGTRKFLRPRVVLYPALLSVLIVLLLVTLWGQAPADITLLRTAHTTFTTLESGEIANSLRIKIVNRTDGPRRYTFAVNGVTGARIESAEAGMELAAGGSGVADAVITTPPTAFRQGRASIQIVVSDDGGFEESVRFRLQGPWGRPAEGTAAQPQAEGETS